MICFIVGAFAGSFLTVCIMDLLAMAKKGDRQ